MGNEQTTDDAASTFSKLIHMGFDEQISLEAAHKYPNPNKVDKAISYIMNTQLKKVKASVHDHGLDVIVLKQGWMEKQGKYIRSWKKRWCILNGEHFLIFKTQNISETPTEWIPLPSIIDVVSLVCEENTNNVFYIQTQDNKYYLRTETESKKKQWINIINKYKNNCIHTSVFIECDRDSQFNDEFKLVIPYNGSFSYPMHALINDIMRYVQQKHKPLKIIPKQIKQESFVRKAMDFSEDCKNLETYITDYDEKSIEEFGICLAIDIKFKCLQFGELKIYFEIIKKKYTNSEKNKENYYEVLSSIVQQIKQNIKLFPKPLDLNMIHFIFINGFLSKQEFNIIVPALLCDELSKLITNIGDRQLSKYVFETKNKQMLSHYQQKDLFKLLKNHYSNHFAIFVFEQFKPNYLQSKLSQRKRYLKLVSIDMMMWVYNYKDTGSHLHLDELKYIFITMKTHAIKNKYIQCVQTLSSVTKQIIEQNAVFITLDADNLYFVFVNKLVTMRRLIRELTAGDLSKLLTKINDKTVEKRIFEDENEQILSHYHHNDLTNLLEEYYSDTFAIFVFQKFNPTFLECSLSERIRYLNAVSVDVLIWIYKYNNTGKQLNILELEYFFQILKEYLTSNNNDTTNHLQILSCITLQIAQTNTTFLTLDADNFHFVFYNQLVKLKIIVSGLSADDLSKSIQNSNDPTIEKHIFEKEHIQLLSQYNQNDLIKLLKAHYSESFAVFVFNQFSPNFLESDLSQREMYLNIVSICRMIWIYNNNETGKHLAVHELTYYFKTMKEYVTAHHNENNYAHWEILSHVTQQLIKQCPQFVALAENLHFIFMNGLVTENVKQIQIIVWELNVNELSTLLQKIKDTNIEQLIFEEKRKQMLLHYSTKDLMTLLKEYYSDSFANFVFNQFKPSFLKSLLSQRKRFAKIVSIQMLIMVYKHNNIGKYLHIAELMYFFNRFKNYVLSQQNKENEFECLEILAAITEQIITQNVAFITSDLSSLNFVFLNHLVKKYQIHIISSKLTATAFSTLIKKINNENISKYIFELSNKQILSHYHHKDLLMLLKKHYSYPFAIFVFERFDGFSKLERTKYLKMICIEMMIWIMNKNGEAVNVSENSEIYIFVNKIKSYISYKNKNKCSQLVSKIIVQKGWLKEISTDDLQLFVNNDLLSKYHVKVIMNEFTKRQKELKENITQLKKTNLKQIESCGHAVIWQWYDITQWKSYDQWLNVTIENLDIDENFTFSCPENKQDYEITKLSSDSGTQINEETKFSRKIRRKIIRTGSNFIDYPKWWHLFGSNNGGSYARPKLVNLNLNRYPAKGVKKAFYKTVNGYKVTKIESVENQMLFDSYWNARNKLLKLIGGENLNERELFHGTGENWVMETVQREGFRKEFNSHSRYGAGTYFARDAQFSIQYSSRKNGVYKMFQCKVVCGQSYIGKKQYTLTKWPKKQNASGLICDSLVDKHDPSIFVIHEDVRAYPMFVIHFIKKEKKQA